MTTIREQGFVLKIATGSAIGVTDESVLDPANMSSGSATAGQVPSADGAGGITWSDEIGPVPSGRQIINGTGITGGGDLSADRTLSVAQSALDPANMSSGSADSGQLPTASGGGAIAWADPPASINLPGSSTDHALVRWDGTDGDTVQDSGVTLSDAGAMVFPAAGSVSKPGAGAGSEAFGVGAAAAGASATSIGPNASAGGLASVAIGNNATIGGFVASVCIGNSTAANATNSVVIGANSESNSNYGVAIGQDAEISADSGWAIAIGNDTISRAEDAITIGQDAMVLGVTSGDNTGAMALGARSRVGDLTPGAGCSAAIALGESAIVGAGHSNAVVIGAAATSTAANRVTFASTLEVEIGQGLGVWGVTPPGSQPAKINDITATAGASYTATEQGMLNDLKARVNSVIDVLEGAGLSSAT